MDLAKLERRIEMVSWRVKNINLGGCGVFALELYKILKFEFGVETEIVFTGWRGPKSIEFDHIMLKHGSVWIDSKGLHQHGPSGKNNTMDVHELFELVNDKQRWNQAFHFYFQDQYFQVISNEEYLIRQMKNYISDRIT